MSRDDAVDKPDTSACNRTDIRSTLVEQWADEALSFQPKGARKSFKRPVLFILIGPRYNHVKTRLERIYLPLFASLIDNFVRPFFRLRLNTSRPLLLLIRARKPCLLARLRRLGW